MPESVSIEQPVPDGLRLQFHVSWTALQQRDARKPVLHVSGTAEWSGTERPAMNKLRS
jgi:hypothetical protein